MRRVGIFYCERCVEDRVFILWEPPWDDYACMCGMCSYQFGQGGYRVASGIVDLNEGRKDAPPDWVEEGRVEPVLAPEVMAAGKLRLRARVRDQIREAYGASSEHERAQGRLVRGLETDDPALRADLLRTPSSAPSDPAARQRLARMLREKR